MVSAVGRVVRVGMPPPLGRRLGVTTMAARSFAAPSLHSFWTRTLGLLEENLVYTVSASSYLSRARAELGSSDTARLFYAAFELRAGIEARLQEYLEHGLDVPKKQKQDWAIAKLGLSVDRAFRFDRVARVEIRERKSGKLLLRVFYTPVSKELRKLGEKLGDYLHATKFRESTDSWWGEFRTKIEVGCHLLEEAVEGNLLTPPLRNRKSGETWLPMTLPAGVTASDIGLKGNEYLLDFQYFTSLADARCDTA